MTMGAMRKAMQYNERVYKDLIAKREQTRPGPDDAVVEAMARAVSKFLLETTESGQESRWEDGHLHIVVYDDTIDITLAARAALAAYRNVMGDDGK